VRRADNLATFMCQLSYKSGSLKLLEPSGPVQACNGIALLYVVKVTMQSNSALCRYIVYTYFVGRFELFMTCASAKFEDFVLLHKKHVVFITNTEGMLQF
jgi:hypothetical protein